MNGTVTSSGRRSGSLTASIMRNVLIRFASRIEHGRLVVDFPDGERAVFGRDEDAEPIGLRILDDAFYGRLLLHGEIGFGEAYMDGLFETSDLVGLLELGVRNRSAFNLDLSWLARPSRLLNSALHRRRRNSRAGSRRNIRAHYDLGNEFFRLFLDETLTYSCAYFTSPDVTLAEAQRGKYGKIAEKLALEPADSVLEIGSGWGGFAMFAAQTYGCHVTTITISEQQFELARERVAAAGLENRVDVQFRDYRDVRGRYDKIASIEMLEAVGDEHFRTFFRTCDALLAPGGRMCVQVITVPDRSFRSLRRGVNWMQKYIFPGGMLPSLAEMERSLRDTSLIVTRVEDIGPHYPETLRRWRDNFLNQLPQVRAQGFDARFERMWEYYLAASEASFLTANTADLQVLFEKPAGRRQLWPARI